MQDKIYNIKETTNPIIDEASKIKHTDKEKEFFKAADKLEDKMNNVNKIAYNVMKNEGIEAAVEHMFKHPKTGEPMDYATMRYYYG